MTRFSVMWATSVLADQIFIFCFDLQTAHINLVPGQLVNILRRDKQLVVIGVSTNRNLEYLHFSLRNNQCSVGLLSDHTRQGNPLRKEPYSYYKKTNKKDKKIQPT